MLREVQCRPDQKIYSECIDSSGRKRFFAATNGKMWKKMQQGDRHYSEVIANKPCHMYWDFDEGDVHAEWKKIEKFVNMLLDSRGLNYTHVLVDSSNEKKQSLHVITVCNMFLLGAPHQGKYFLYMLKDYFKADLSSVDTTIYTRNRCFRMLGSSKYGSDRKLKGSWTKEHWEKTLVQPICELEHFNWGPPITESLRSYGNTPPCVADAIKWFGGNPNYFWRHSGTWTYVGHLKRGSVCPIAKRVHKHNNIFFTLRLGFPLKLTCHKCEQCVEKELPMQEDINAFLNTVL